MEVTLQHKQSRLWYNGNCIEQIMYTSVHFLVHPERIVFGRTYVLPQMFYFFLFQREISEMCRPIGAKFCTVISTRPNFIMPDQTFGGPPQAKNMKNLARFRTTSKFGDEYLRNG